MRPKPLATEMARGFVLYVLRWPGAVTVIDARRRRRHFGVPPTLLRPRNRSQVGTADSEMRSSDPACGASLLGGPLAQMETDCMHGKGARVTHSPCRRGGCCPPLEARFFARSDSGRPCVAFEIRDIACVRPPANHDVTAMALCSRRRGFAFEQVFMFRDRVRVAWPRRTGGARRSGRPLGTGGPGGPTTSGRAGGSCRSPRAGRPRWPSSTRGTPGPLSSLDTFVHGRQGAPGHQRHGYEHANSS